MRIIVNFLNLFGPVASTMYLNKKSTYLEERVG